MIKILPKTYQLLLSEKRNPEKNPSIQQAFINNTPPKSTKKWKNFKRQKRALEGGGGFIVFSASPGHRQRRDSTERGGGGKGNRGERESEQGVVPGVAVAERLWAAARREVEGGGARHPT